MLFLLAFKSDKLLGLVKFQLKSTLHLLINLLSQLSARNWVVGRLTQLIVFFFYNKSPCDWDCNSIGVDIPDDSTKPLLITHFLMLSLLKF